MPKMIASVLVLLDYSFSLLKKSSLVKLLLGHCSTCTLSRSPFKFELPPFEADAVIDTNCGIRFRPPVYVQRYCIINRIFEAKKPLGGCKKIVDFGCAEIALFNYVKQVEGVEEYIAVDIDEELLSRYACRILPLPFDFLSDERCHPFNVKVLCGSVADPDVRLLGTDVVVAIELIEHLYPEPLEDLPYNIFGVIQPDVAVFTTPNSDFNVLFKDLIGFRHDDHKFEWSRQQFKDWADNLVVRYPNYEVELSGIGPGPVGTDHLGCSTQAATFFRKGPRVTVDDHIPLKETYKVIKEVNYPFKKPEELLENAVRYNADTFIRVSIASEKYLVNEEHRIPLHDVVEFINRKQSCTELQVRTILKDIWTIVEEERSHLIVVPYDDDEDGWSNSSQATSTDRYLVTDLEEFRENIHATEDSDWDLEPDNELTLHLNETDDMNEEDRIFVSGAVGGEPPPMMEQSSHSVSDVAPLEPRLLDDVACSPVVINNINRGDPSAITLPKCHSLEQINASSTKNKSFRFSLNMEKNDPFSCDISSANSESKDRDKSVPSFSESFGLRLEDSCSQSKAVDSGYPNSYGQDMDMDLTPEQVDEIITETESSFDGDDESISGDELDGQEQPHPNREMVGAMANPPPVLRFLDNVENGDVANNNRDGEGNNMEDNRLVGEALEFVQDVIQQDGDLQHLNMAEARALHYPDVESDDEAISNTVDGSSQADSTLPMLDDDTIQRCLADRGIAVVMGDAPSVSSDRSIPITPFNTRNPSVDDLIGEEASSVDGFPSWLCNILIDDDDGEDFEGGGDTDTLDRLVGGISDDDVPHDELEGETPVDHAVPGDMQGGGDPYYNRYDT